jgi:HCOMODA/2-hydroxy-3-carboxy-muconic semialdehyde decarboxylase
MHEQDRPGQSLLVLANRILANEGVLDAFGHVSVRQPGRPGQFLLSCSRAPELVESGDILEFDGESQPVIETRSPLYIERFIHGEIYRARPDVNAICHHHAAAVMPFCISGATLRPVYQHGAMLGAEVPFWNSRDEFGDTNLLVTDVRQGASLARSLGPHSVVLMRNHGATVVGTTLVELVFRSVTSCLNAQFQLAASQLGQVQGLTPGETAKAGHVSPAAMERAWAYWASRLSARHAVPA